MADLSRSDPGASSLGADAPARPTPYSAGYKRLVLGLLVAAYAINCADRYIVGVLGQAIKVDLKISDTQLGLLGGLYFALLYTVLGIPIARLAERANRINIISTAIVVWSGFTALCGTAHNFVLLAAYRFGVGVGEAGLTPPAHSLISDLYEKNKRASALAVYSLALPLGTFLSAVVGGYIAQYYSWRAAFITLGLAGLVVAVAMKLVVREPRAELGPFSTKPAPFSLRTEVNEISAVVKALFGRWAPLNVLLGITFISLATYGKSQFTPAFYIRAFGLNYAEIGLLIGLIGGISQAVGTLAGGFVTDRLARFGSHWYVLVPAIGTALSYPFALGVYTADTWQTAALFMAAPGLFSFVYLGPTFALVQNLVPSTRRATAAAVLLFFVNIVALAGGPPLTGWFIDHFAAYLYANPANGQFWTAMGGFLSAAPQLFHEACPGGMAPDGASLQAKLACHAALDTGTRYGLILAFGFAMLAAVHYALAAFGLRRALAQVSDAASAGSAG